MKRILLFVFVSLFAIGCASIEKSDVCISGDCQNGQGTMTWPDGTKYIGEFKNGKPNGQGKKEYSDGFKYVGEFKDGERNGQGTMTYPDGTKYVGQWKDWTMNGQGTMTYPDGSQYVGEFKDGERNGQGTMTYPDGTKEAGEFKDDKKIEQEKDESDSIKAQTTAEEVAYEAEVSAYRADTATILQLLGNIRDFHHGNSDDTEVQAKAKERKLEKALVQFNSRCKGTRLTLQRSELYDVTAETVSSGIWSSKETGKYTATYYIPVPCDKETRDEYGIVIKYGIAIAQKKDNVGYVYEDLRQGLPIGKLDFESFEYLDVVIVKTYPNENSVINLKKGSVGPLTGTIRRVLYEEPGYGNRLTIWID